MLVIQRLILKRALMLGLLLLASHSFAANGNICGALMFENAVSHDSQNSVEQRISYGMQLNIDLYNVADVKESIWVISHEGKVFSNGKGISLFDVVFDIPGLYVITFEHDHSTEQDHGGCNHYEEPPLTNLIVSPVRMELLCEAITFSSPLVGGRSMDGVIMSVPVLIHVYTGGNAPVEISLETISYGIGTSLVGKMTSPVSRVKSGELTLEFVLSGEATSNTYIGFDIIDNNGNVIPCGITTPIR